MAGKWNASSFSVTRIRGITSFQIRVVDEVRWWESASWHGSTSWGLTFLDVFKCGNIVEKYWQSEFLDVSAKELMCFFGGLWGSLFHMCMEMWKSLYRVGVSREAWDLNVDGWICDNNRQWSRGRFETWNWMLACSSSSTSYASGESLSLSWLKIDCPSTGREGSSHPLKSMWRQLVSLKCIWFRL